MCTAKETNNQHPACKQTNKTHRPRCMLHVCEIPHKAPRNMLTVTVKLTNVLKLGNSGPRLSGTRGCSPWLLIENHLISGALFPTPFKHNPKLRTRPLEKGTSPAVGARRAQSLHNAEIWSWWRGAFQAAHAWWPRWFSSRWSCGSQLKWGMHRGRGGPAEWTTGETQPVAFTPHLQRGSWRSTEDVFLSTKHRAALGD